MQQSLQHKSSVFCLFTVRELRLRNIAWGCFISPQPCLRSLCSLLPSLSLFLNHESFHPISLFSLLLWLFDFSLTFFSPYNFLPSPSLILFNFLALPSFGFHTHLLLLHHCSRPPISASVIGYLCAFLVSPLPVKPAASRGGGSTVTVDRLQGRRGRASESYRE